MYYSSCADEASKTYLHEMNISTHANHNLRNQVKIWSHVAMLHNLLLVLRKKKGS